jgi:hypothetical protein
MLVSVLAVRIVTLDSWKGGDLKRGQISWASAALLANQQCKAVRLPTVVRSSIPQGVEDGTGVEKRREEKKARSSGRLENTIGPNRR